MKIFVLLFCCGLALATELQSQPNPPIVGTYDGPIKGSIMKTRLGKDIFAFRGIRYGEAPLGENRFKQAKPAKPHAEIFDASEEGPICPTMFHDNHERIMSEDCLRLNVYSNKLPTLSADREDSTMKEIVDQPNKDVVVFIHPCVFSMWSGSSYDFGPQNLLDRDIVLVTLNHRLASLGFMSTGDERAPGNAGLKDQVLALRWIQKNIKYFGGNPNSVTLMGYSHGAWSIQLHMVSPMSKGLFHRAISMSGAATSHNPLPYEQTYLAKMQAAAIECPIDNMEAMFQCLYTKPTTDYTNTIHHIYETENPFGHGHFVWQPVVEPSTYGPNSTEESFIDQQLVDLIIAGKINSVPLMIGVTEDEFGGDVMVIEEQAQAGNSSMYDDFNIRWEDKVSQILRYNPESAVGQVVSTELRKLYLQGIDVSEGRWQGLAAMLGDRMTFPTHRFERLMALHSSQPVYNYLFAYSGCETFARWQNGRPFGVSHHDDLLLYFKVGDFPAVCARDVPILERLTKMIENFAKTGSPTPLGGGDSMNILWQPSTLNSPKYMRISKQFSMKHGIIHSKRMMKWDQLFPIGPFGDLRNSTEPSQGEVEHQHHHNHCHHSFHHSNMFWFNGPTIMNNQNGNGNGNQNIGNTERGGYGQNGNGNGDQSIGNTEYGGYGQNGNGNGDQSIGNTERGGYGQNGNGNGNQSIGNTNNGGNGQNGNNNGNQSIGNTNNGGNGQNGNNNGDQSIGNTNNGGRGQNGNDNGDQSIGNNEN